MANEIIKLSDGLLVEIDTQFNPEIAQNQTPRAVEKGIDQIKGILAKIVHPFEDVWSELNQNVVIETAEVEVGLSFEGEGNLYFAKSKAGTNLSVKLTFKPAKK